MKEVDYIIVGQGIAGTMLANQLLQDNFSIYVIDKFEPNASSNIATGVVNPVTGRKMVKSWMIDEVLPFAKKTYRSLESFLQYSFFHDKEIYKVFSSVEDVQIWNAKRNDSAYANYLGDIISTQEANISIEAPFGIGIIKNACWLDVPLMTKLFRQYLLEKDVLMEAHFDIDLLEISTDICYKNIKAKGIIFCEGYRACNNPYFNWIPFTLAKGEQLLIHSDDLALTSIVNKNIFLVPKGNAVYSVGSTFIWNDTTETVTADGRKEITDKLSKITSASYAILEEKAGIRPTMRDRRPVIGQHPIHLNIFIFNGLGTKGVSLSPYFAQHFSGYLRGINELLQEISLQRLVE